MTTDSTGTGSRLPADALRSARFGQAKHGYDRDQVHGLLARAADRIDAADAETARLRAELARLNAERQREREPAGEGDEDVRMEISVRAVALLSRAQQSADNAVAEAEAYARDLVMTARGQYTEILQRAQQAVAESSRALPDVPAGEPIPEIEYVRTYARVAQVQLRSVLDALTAEVDKLESLARPSDQPRPTVNWQSAPRQAASTTQQTHQAQQAQPPVPQPAQLGPATF